VSGLAEALVEVQKNLPHVHKGRTANVRTKDGGSYSYSYADLGDIAEQLLPVLTANGLAFAACPTVADGEFVLAYALVHESGEKLEGRYPLPKGGTPQQQGSAITYARRYALCAVTGLVADDDDDAQSAEKPAPSGERAERPSKPSEPAQAPTLTAKQKAVRDAITGLDKAGRGLVGEWMSDKNFRVSTLTDEQADETLKFVATVAKVPA
jgi:hypothetical protein